MKKLLFALVAVALMTACTENDEMNSSLDYVVTGYNETNADTRTAFGTPNANTIPFLWTSGDYIWLGSTKSDAITSDCQIAQFIFSSGSPAIVGTGHVFYNMTATSTSNNAYVLDEQTADGNLGNDGDFGYATLDAYGSFCLKHKTSYIWFDITTGDADMPKLTSIKLDADGVNIAGKQTYDFNNDCWSATVTEGSSIITLTFEGGHTLKASNAGVMAAMVCLPAAISGKTLTVTYTFEDGSTFTETKIPTKDLVVGATTRIKTKIAKDQLVKEPSYELRVLTFEDEDYKGSESTDTYWSDFIPDSQYGGGHASYEWYDEGNTELAYMENPDALFRGYGGHAGISNYVSDDWENIGLGIYPDDLQAYNVNGGHSGTNFNTHFGYLDESGYGMMSELMYFQFGDDKPRVIDHMWVTNTTYVYNQLHTCSDYGSGDYELSDTTTYKIVAYGYDSWDDEEPTTAEFYLLNIGKQFVTEWTKWDLSSLGKVVKVEFNLVGSSDLEGTYGLFIPGYFAYDDVAVRFEK